MPVDFPRLRIIGPDDQPLVGARVSQAARTLGFRPEKTFQLWQSGHNLNAAFARERPAIRIDSPPIAARCASDHHTMSRWLSH